MCEQGRAPEAGLLRRALRFGLAAQLSIRAISKTVEAYKRDKTLRPRFRPHGAVPYDDRIMPWRGVERVSLLTLDGRAVIPIILAPYQAGRIDRRRGQADLVYREGTFYLYVTVDVPEPPVQDVPDYLGVDLGIVNVAVDLDGTTYSGEAVERKRHTDAHRRRNLRRKQTRAASGGVRAGQAQAGAASAASSPVSLPGGHQPLHQQGCRESRQRHSAGDRPWKTSRGFGLARSQRFAGARGLATAIGHSPSFDHVVSTRRSWRVSRCFWSTPASHRSTCIRRSERPMRGRR